MTTEEFKEKISASLPCRISASGDCSSKMDEFLARCYYQAGQYDDPEDFKSLDALIRQGDDGDGGG